MNSPSRYHSLLKVCDLACAHAATTQADQHAEFWDTIASALSDDCPQQSQAATSLANSLRIADAQRAELLKLIAPGNADGNGSTSGQ